MNILEIYQTYGVQYAENGQHEHARRGWVQTDCPYCSPDWKHFRLGFNLKSKYYTCWACGPHRFIDTLMMLTGTSFPEAKALVDSYDPMLLTPRNIATLKKTEVTLPACLGPLQEAHRSYLMRRGLNPRTIQDLWGVKGIGNAAYLQWRLFIPIFYDLEIISWTTRSISDSAEKRYIAASEDDEKLPGKSVLYGEDYCKNGIIIVEGPVDVWKVGRGAVGTLGLSYTQSQLLRMVNYPLRIVCFDSTPEGQTRANTLCEALKPFPGVTRNVILDAKDPGSAKEKELRILRKMLKQK